MLDRKRQGLRGPVRSITVEIAHPAVTDASGKTHPEARSECLTKYDANGRPLVYRSRNADGSQWVTRYRYDSFGRLLEAESGVEGKELTETIYSYDSQGRLENIAITRNQITRSFFITTSKEGKPRS